jgi:hypothetical protein
MLDVRYWTLNVDRLLRIQLAYRRTSDGESHLATVAVTIPNGTLTRSR